MRPVTRTQADSSSPRQTLNVGLLWHTVYLPNMGVNALTYATLRYLEAAAEELGVHFSYVMFGHNLAEEDNFVDQVSIGGEPVAFRFRKLSLPGLNVKSPRSWFRLWRWFFFHRQEIVGRFAESDILLDISYGDSFTDIYGTNRFLQTFLSKFLALETGKPLVLLPQTIGPFNHSLAKRLAHGLLRRINHVYPRDLTSLAYLEKAVPERKFKNYLDVAFYLPYEPVHFEAGKIHVGLNVSGLLWQGGYTRNNMFNLKSDYQQVVRDIIRFFLAQKDVRLHLIPHVVSNHLPLTSNEDDYLVSGEICREFNGTVTLSPAFADPVQAKSYISGLDFFAGSRMHGCIAAYSSNVPVLPMAYSRKFSGLFLSSLQYPALIDLKQDDRDEILQKIRAGFEGRTALRQAILARREAVNADIAAFRQELKCLFEPLCRG